MRNLKNFGSWCLCIWQIGIFGVVFWGFQKLLFRKLAGEKFLLEENIWFIFLAVSLLLCLKTVIRTLWSCCKRQAEKEACTERTEPSVPEGRFLERYQKRRRRDMLLVLSLPFLSFLGILFALPIFSKGVISRSDLFRSWDLISSVFPLRFFMFILGISLFLFFRIYFSQRSNVKKLLYFYSHATKQEIQDLDRIEEGQVGYVFGHDFLINGEGFLNIIRLKDIKNIQYIDYFYVLVFVFFYGTKLKITAEKKYVLWHHAPIGEEWIRKGFFLPDEDRGKEVRMDEQLPI